MEKRRSKGVTIIAWLHLIGGYLFLAVSLLSIALLFVSSSKISGHISRLSEGPPVLSETHNTTIAAFVTYQEAFKSIQVLFALHAVFALLAIVIGHGLLKLKENVRRYALYFAWSVFAWSLLWFLMIWNGLIVLLKGIEAPTIWNLIQALIWPSIVTFFLTRPKVKEQFRR